MPSPSRCMQTRRKIADPLEACTREEQDAVTRFLGVWRYEAEKYACPECIVPGEECWEITFSQREPLESGDICLFVFFFFGSKDALFNFMGRKMYAHAFLGLPRSTHGTLLAHGNHYQQRSILWSASEPLKICSQIKMSRFAQFLCVVTAR